MDVDRDEVGDDWLGFAWECDCDCEVGAAVEPDVGVAGLLAEDGTQARAVDSVAVVVVVVVLARGGPVMGMTTRVSEVELEGLGRAVRLWDAVLRPLVALVVIVVVPTVILLAR